jgi:hypothetical protein
MKTSLKRLLAAGTAVVLCVAMIQSPAMATAYVSHITAGTMDLHNTASTVTSIPLGTTGTGCPPGTVGLDITTTTASLTSLSHTEAFSLGTGNFIATYTLSTVNTPATIDSTTTPHTFDSSTTSIRRVIRTNLGNCVQGTTVVCTLSATIHWEGTITSTSDSQTGTSNGSGSTGGGAALLTITPPCSPPFTTFIGGDVSVNNVAFHVCLPAAPPTSC